MNRIQERTSRESIKRFFLFHLLGNARMKKPIHNSAVSHQEGIKNSSRPKGL